MEALDLDAIEARHREAQGRARRAFVAHGPQALIAFTASLGEDVPALVARVRELEAEVQRDCEEGVVLATECGDKNERIAVVTWLRTLPFELRHLGATDLADAIERGDHGAALVGRDLKPDNIDLDLLRKLASGEGGERTGALKRAGLLDWVVTDAGCAALGIDRPDLPHLVPRRVYSIACNDGVEAAEERDGWRRRAEQAEAEVTRMNREFNQAVLELDMARRDRTAAERERDVAARRVCDLEVCAMNGHVEVAAGGHLECNRCGAIL